MRRALLSGAVVLVGIVAACGFPDPELVLDDGGTVPPGDAARGGDTGGRLEPGTCRGTDPCDCDDDKIKGSSAECGTGADCDDLDPRAQPGADWRPDVPTALAGNWDCDATVEKRWDGNVNCSALGGAGPCSEREGFTDEAPECGAEGAWVKCTPQAGGLACGNDGPPVMRKQECR